MWWFTMRTIHEVEPRSNLDLILRAANGVGNRLVDAINSIGTGLQAIALAVSTPEDNSAEVQKKLDELTEKLAQSSNELDAAVKANQPKP